MSQLRHQSNFEGVGKYIKKKKVLERCGAGANSRVDEGWSVLSPHFISALLGLHSEHVMYIGSRVGRMDHWRTCCLSYGS